jgi:hypothetical protein
VRTFRRPRRYVARHWVTLARPVLRYSQARDAYVLRLVGRKYGPVLKVDRRSSAGGFDGAAERRGSARVA